MHRHQHASRANIPRAVGRPKHGSCLTHILAAPNEIKDRQDKATTHLASVFRQQPRAPWPFALPAAMVPVNPVRKCDNLSLSLRVESTRPSMHVTDSQGCTLWARTHHEWPHDWLWMHGISTSCTWAVHVCVWLDGWMQRRHHQFITLARALPVVHALSWNIREGTTHSPGVVCSLGQQNIANQLCHYHVDCSVCCCCRAASGTVRRAAMPLQCGRTIFALLLMGGSTWKDGKQGALFISKICVSFSLILVLAFILALRLVRPRPPSTSASGCPTV